MKIVPAPIHGEGTGHGKLLLFGEHSAVYGEPAVGIPLPVKTTLTLELSPAGIHGQGEISYDGLTRDETTLLWQIFKAMAGDTETPIQAETAYTGRVRYRSTIPPGGGYGSSAAVCAAAAAALAPAFAFSSRDLPQIANRGEAIFHGTPSGIDAVLSLQKGLTAVYPTGNADDKAAFPEWTTLSGYGLFIVTGTIPREKTTKELVAGLRRQKEDHPKKTDDTLKDLGRIARSAIEGMNGAMNCSDLGALASRAHSFLSDLGLSTPLLDSIILTGKSAGACGGKLSGAGGGGAFVLFCAGYESARGVYGAVRDYTKRAVAGATILPIIEIGDSTIHERYR